MSFWPVPDISKENIYEIEPSVFTSRGIRLIFLDVDNTLAPYGDNEAPPRLRAWVERLRGAGLEPFILSNNRGDRPRLFAGQLGVDFAGRARKPFTKTARRVLEEKRCPPERAAFIGDQIYTDTLCARRLGAFSVLVEPIKLSNLWLRLRYWLECPFRLGYKCKNRS